MSYSRLILFSLFGLFSISLYAADKSQHNEFFENQSSVLQKVISIERLKEQAVELDKGGIVNKQKALHKYQKRKFISDSTNDYHLTGYVNNCRARIFRIGNLTAPYFLGRNGRVILEVSISSDGRLESLELVKSSGFKEIDDSAIKAIKVAAPFAKFPDKVKQNLDVITFRQPMSYRSGYRMFYRK